MSTNTLLNLQVDASARLGMNHQIANQIQEKIESGEILPADKLPPEQVLASDLNVSRDVVRRAYAILKTNGLIESLKRDGWHVRQS